jgi:hypothetical protein
MKLKIYPKRYIKKKKKKNRKQKEKEKKKKKVWTDVEVANHPHG